jgi:hypothetical protein
MLDRLVVNWQKLTVFAQTRFRWLGYLLIIAAFGYIGVILILQGPQLRDIPWRDYWVACLITLGLYLLSLLVQFFNWTRMLSYHHDINIQDLIIYFKVLVLRRLPGGVWHWVGRAALYSGVTEVSPRAIMMANFMEWTLLLLTAAGIAVLGLDSPVFAVNIAFTVVIIGLAIYIATRWKSSTSESEVRLCEGFIWVSLYALSWVIGGLVVFAFVKTAGSSPITWWETTWIWALTGGSSLLVIIVPTGLGIREIALLLLLKPYLQTTDALIVAMLIRFTFTLADILWGMIGLGLGQFIASRKRMNEPSP